MTSQFAIYQPDKILCCRGHGEIQIVMRLKVLPITGVRLDNFKLNGWPLPKTPPREMPGLGVQHPVGLEPVEHIVMRGKENNLSGGIATPPALSKGQ